MRAGGWDVALLEVGTLPLKAEMLGPDGAFDGPQTVPSNALLLRREGRTVLVDTGAGHLARLWPGLVDDLDGALAAAGSSTGRGGCAGAHAPRLRPLRRRDVGRRVARVHQGDGDRPARGGGGRPRARPRRLEPRPAAGRGLRRRGPIWWRRPPATPWSRTSSCAPRPDTGRAIPCSTSAASCSTWRTSSITRRTSSTPTGTGASTPTRSSACATRLEVLGEAAGAGVTVAASHIPGFARIVPAGSGLRWQPL